MNNFKKLLVFFIISICTQSSFSQEMCADLFLPLFLRPNQLQTIALTIREFEKVNNPLEHGLVEINRYMSQYNKSKSHEFNPKKYVWDAGGANYIFKYEKSLEVLKTEYPQLVNILYHPGVFFRLDDFIEFIKSYPHATVVEALDLYAKHLGKKVYYRALYLDEKTAQAFMKRKKNILANNMYIDRKGIAKYPDYWYEYKPAVKSRPISFSDYTDSLYDNIVDHVLNRSSKFVLSVTELPEVALAVGQMLKSENPTEDKKVYLAKILVPAINVIPNLKKEDHAFLLNIRLNNKLVMKKIDVSDDRVESFMFFGIDRHDIVDFSENDTPYTLEMIRKSKSRKTKK